MPRKLPAEDIAAYVTRGISYEQYPYRASVILHAPVERMAELVPCTLGTLEAIDEHRCLVHLGAYSIEMLAGYLGMFAVDFEVSEPPELIEQIQRLATRFTHAASVSAPSA